MLSGWLFGAWCRWLNTWVWIVGGWLDEWLEVGWLVQADGWTHVLGLVNSSPFGCRPRRWGGLDGIHLGAYEFPLCRCTSLMNGACLACFRPPSPAIDDGHFILRSIVQIGVFSYRLCMGLQILAFMFGSHIAWDSTMVKHFRQGFAFSCRSNECGM